MKGGKGAFHLRLEQSTGLLPPLLLAFFVISIFGCDSPREPLVPAHIRLHGDPVAAGEPFELQVSGTGLDQLTRAVLTRDLGNRSQVINDLPLWGTVFGIELQGNFAYLANNTKGLVVADVSDFQKPTVAASLKLPGKTLKVYPHGDLLVAANELSGVQLVDISKPSRPVLISSVATRGRAFDLDIGGDLLFVAVGAEGLLIIDISRPEQPVVVSRFRLPGRSLAIKLIGQHVYLAGTEVLAAVDVSDPEHPAMRETLALGHNGFQIDYYKNRIFVTLGPLGLLVVDISSPGHLKSVGRVEDLGHVSRVSLDAGRAYLASNYGALVLDLEAAPLPKLLGGVMGNHRVTDVAARHGTVLTTDTSYGIEVIDLHQPVPFGFFRAPIDGRHTVFFNAAEQRCEKFQPDNLRSWSSQNIIRSFQLLDDGQLFYFLSDGRSAVQRATTVYLGTDSGVLTLDLGRSGEIRVTARSQDDQPVGDLVLADDYLYGAADRQGLLVYRLNNSGFPELIRQVPGQGSVSALAMADDVIYLTGQKGGLTLFDVTDRERPTLVGSLRLPYPLDEFSNPSDIIVHKGRAYIADGPNGLITVDVTDLREPTLVALAKTEGTARNIIIQDDYLYLADSRSGVRIFDITCPDYPIFISSMQVPILVWFFTILENRLGAATQNSTLFWTGTPVEADGIRQLDADTMAFSFPAVSQPGRYSLRVFNETGGVELGGAVTIGNTGGGI